MRELTKWTAVYAAHWALLYLAFASGVDGALYVIKFFAWIMAVLSIFLLSDSATEDTAKKPPQPVRWWLSMVQAWATLGCLIWFWHVVTALAWGFAMVMFYVHRAEVRKARAARAAGCTA